MTHIGCVILSSSEKQCKIIRRVRGSGGGGGGDNIHDFLVHSVTLMFFILVYP